MDDDRIIAIIFLLSALSTIIGFIGLLSIKNKKSKAKIAFGILFVIGAVVLLLASLSN